MPDSQQPYIDPNMQPNMGYGQFATNYPGGAPQDYPEAGMPHMGNMGAGQVDPQAAWGGMPYGGQSYGAPQPPYGDGFGGMSGMSGISGMGGQDPYQNMGADSGYYGSSQYDAGFGYGDAAYQTQSGGYQQPYQPDPYAPDPFAPGAQPTQQGFPYVTPDQQYAGGSQSDYSAWQQSGQTIPDPSQAAQPYGQTNPMQSDVQIPPVVDTSAAGVNAGGSTTMTGAAMAGSAVPGSGAAGSAVGPAGVSAQAGAGGVQAGAVSASGVSGAQAPAPMQPQPEAYPNYDYPVMTIPMDLSYPTKGRAMQCLILGILSIVLALIPPVGIILAVITLRISKKYLMNGGTDGKAEAGRIFGVAGLVFSILTMAFMIGFVCFMVGALTGTSGARDLIIYFNASPLGSLFQIPLP